MADEIGYVTLSEANEYIATHYISSDSLRDAWLGLEDSDREALLLKSFETIEVLPFSGRKTDPAQSTAFPRFPSQEVPQAVKAAQIENALSSADSSATEDAAYYGRLWQFGIQSYSIGNLSERIGEGSWSSGPLNSAVSGLVSAIAIRLLKPFISGSFRMKGRRC